MQLKLSKEHEGFVFERNLSKAVDSLVLHSGGKVSAALSKASKNGQIGRLMDEALQDETSKEGEQVKSPYKCNTIIEHRLDISDCKESNPNDCHRKFHLYLPQIVCDISLREAGGDLESIGTLPLVFVVHCFGCSGQTVMTAFHEFANTHNVIIVAPEGLRSSFNGLDCCGYALDSKIDDVGFFSEIQSMMEEEYPFVNSGVSYATGWSNGGFMVMFAAKLFRAIAPISGYIIDYPELTAYKSIGKGIFFHHSVDDPFVRSTGCCHDPDLPSCCCGIFAEQCISVQNVMKNFAQEVNGCNIEDDGQSKSEVELEQSYKDEQVGITCLTSTSSSCAANNTICMYDHSGHFNSNSFERSFPMAEQIIDFFARDACNINGGLWSDQTKQCDCQYSGYGGTFCLGDSVDSFEVAESSEGAKVITELQVPSKEPNHTFTGILLLVTMAGLCVVKQQLNKRKRKDKDELDDETDEKVELVTASL
jgi:poly(3-hydroxybutyrate) depolymerase